MRCQKNVQVTLRMRQFAAAWCTSNTHTHSGTHRYTRTPHILWVSKVLLSPRSRADICCVCCDLAPSSHSLPISTLFLLLPSLFPLSLPSLFPFLQLLLAAWALTRRHSPGLVSTRCAGGRPHSLLPAAAAPPTSRCCLLQLAWLGVRQACDKFITAT